MWIGCTAPFTDTRAIAGKPRSRAWFDNPDKIDMVAEPMKQHLIHEAK